MALSCPNKSLPEWKRLVDEVGEREALNDYFQFGTIRSPYAVKDKLERLNIANYTNKNFKIGERYFKPTVESLIDVEKNSSVVDAMVTHFGYRGLQSEEDLIKRKFTQLYQYHKDIEPEQIHILSSKKDIEGFKKFVTQPTTQSVKPGVSELFESDPKLANAVYESLGFNFRYTSEKWKDDPTTENKATYINIKGTPSNQEFQIKKDTEDGFYSVHFKTEQGKLTKEQIQTLVDAIASQIPIGGKLSTHGAITKGGISGLNRFLNNGFKKVGEREIKDREGNPIIIPILEKVEKSNLEQQAQQLYSQYLDTVFPNSKVKDIVYHGSNERRDYLDPGKQVRGRFGKGVSFASTIELVKQLIDDAIIHAAIIDLKNPLTDIPDTRAEVQPLVEAGNHDGVQVGKIEYTVPTKEQIHILGSKQDIEGFKEFVTTRNIINTYGINITNEDDIRPVETNINNEEKSLKLALKGLTPEEKISFCNHFGITMTEENGTKC